MLCSEQRTTILEVSSGKHTFETGALLSVTLGLYLCAVIWGTLVVTSGLDVGQCYVGSRKMFGDK